MDATEPQLLALEPLRHSSSALLAALGVVGARASALVGQLLWFDAIGASKFGISTLPSLLNALHAGTISAKFEGKVGPERAATAVVDGNNGIGALILARAGRIAVEKARDVGVGLVRVKGITAVGSAAGIVAEMAVGPVAATALGPQGVWSVALPSFGGQPLIADSALGGGDRPAEMALPWRVGLEAGDWLIQAITVAALEPLASLHQRVESADRAGGGWCPPEAWEASRKDARERGILLGGEVVAAFRAWADRLGVADRLPNP